MDDRLSQIEKPKQQAISESEKTYEGLLQDNQNNFDSQTNFLNQYEQQQNDILDKQLAYNERINQQNREKAQQTMEAEQKRAKNDFVSYTNPYGLQAESFASQGLLNSGVSETAKLGAYNTYQNRNAAANKAYQDAILQYDNEMAEARLNHDTQMAQNALAKLQSQMDLYNNYYNNKSSITQNRLGNRQSLDSEYFNRYNTEYNNIQQEKAREEAIRQWQAQFDYQKQQDALAQQNWEKEYALSKQTANTRYGSGGSSSISLTDGSNNNETLTDSSSPDTFGNSQETMNKSDYYFKSTTGEDYQPRYINNRKLSKTNRGGESIKLSDVGQIPGISGSKNVWNDGAGNYYVWSKNTYVDITDMVNSWAATTN